MQRLGTKLFITLSLLGSTASAQVQLPRIFADHMVLQRDKPIRIWGKAGATEQVRISLGPHQGKTTADDSGHWRLDLPQLPAGGPHTMVVQGTNTLTLRDILIGEVWLCSGQSNMEMGMKVIANSEAEIAAAKLPKIRLCSVDRATAGQPRDDFKAKWRVCSPATITAGGSNGFSATAFFFGRRLHRELGVPIGLIDSTWGGTRIEPWTPACGFAAVAKVEDIGKRMVRQHRDYMARLPRELDRLEAWIKSSRKALVNAATTPSPAPIPRHPGDHRGATGSLYNGMIHPLVPMSLRGAIWYQGESNVGNGMRYFELMKALVGGWREVFQQGDLPFYYVQIAPYRYRKNNDSVPQIWEAQAAAQSIPNTGMIVTTDIGNLRDIHPRNKQDVGLRLANWALAKTYGRTDIAYASPMYRSMQADGPSIRLSFDHTGGALKSRDGKPLSWFEIAGADGEFHKATATIDGDTVLVTSEAVARPTTVRFGWDELAEPNLVNRAGLPASPFRTSRGK